MGPDELTARPLLRADGLCVRFGALQALQDVGLRVHPGELVALAGDNGAGKTTLVRCLAGDLSPTEGRVLVDGVQLQADLAAGARAGISVVWQDLALCDNLDVATNLLLGREERWVLPTAARGHARARNILRDLGIPVGTTSIVQSLTDGQRQMVALARAMSSDPRLLILDEATSALGAAEAEQVAELMFRLHRQGTTILFVSHDVDQMFRLADRILVLPGGRLVGDLEPAAAHPDDVLALIAGHEPGSSAHRQISRLHGLADELAVTEPSSSLSLILSTLGSALRADELCIHVVNGDSLRVASSLGLPPDLLSAWATLPLGAGGGPMGVAAATNAMAVDPDVRTSGGRGTLAPWAPYLQWDHGRIGSSWAVPFAGGTEVLGVITVFRPGLGRPPRDEVDLVTLYAGYAATAVERDRLMGELTARNRVLETIREVLETLAGPVPLGDGLGIALRALCRGLEADAVALLHAQPGAEPTCSAVAGALDGLVEAAASVLDDEVVLDAHARGFPGADGAWNLAVPFPSPDGAAVLVARWVQPSSARTAVTLLEDAANSLRLALEREKSELVHEEATALRRSQELQQQFLARLSHELRTPLTAIRGYASSLLQRDVTWDPGSRGRFLTRIAAESARLGRLVDQLLDLSAIEADILRIQPDWCDLQLVLDAAVACLPADSARMVDIRCDPGLSPVWADHDLLEQVFVNLMDNAVRHNPPGTRVRVAAAATGPDLVRVSVRDDGCGLPDAVVSAPFEPRAGRPSTTSGSGLGLSITRGIIRAHDGRITVRRHEIGTEFEIELPVEREPFEAAVAVDG